MSTYPMPVGPIVDKLERNPKKLFLIDGIGASLSALLLGIVLVKFERIFGIPASTLYLLAAFPVGFVIFDLSCYQRGSDRLGLLLSVIATLNLLYCCLSLGFAFYHYDTITILGWTYFLIEIVLVCALATIEIRVANKLSRSVVHD